MVYERFGVNFYFGGTSLLIVVGVAMDTVNQVESQLIMRHYEGFTPRSGQDPRPENVVSSSMPLRAVYAACKRSRRFVAAVAVISGGDAWILKRHKLLTLRWKRPWGL